MRLNNVFCHPEKPISIMIRSIPTSLCHHGQFYFIVVYELWTPFIRYFHRMLEYIPARTLVLLPRCLCLCASSSYSWGNIQWPGKVSCEDPVPLYFIIILNLPEVIYHYSYEWLKLQFIQKNLCSHFILCSIWFSNYTYEANFWRIVILPGLMNKHFKIWFKQAFFAMTVQVYCQNKPRLYVVGYERIPEVKLLCFL